mgnify:CR=1 FL=1
MFLLAGSAFSQETTESSSSDDVAVTTVTPTTVPASSTTASSTGAMLHRQLHVPMSATSPIAALSRSLHFGPSLLELPGRRGSVGAASLELPWIEPKERPW